MNTPYHWTGRQDLEELGNSTRWHQHVQARHDSAHGGVTLIGFAVDEGVRRNGGRPGAAQGPHAIRQFLAGTPHLNEPAIWDAGDVTCEGEALEAAQTALAQKVAASIAQKSLPITLGGGHEVAWGSFQGIAQACQAHASSSAPRILIVNLDAHFDLRMAGRANSGTPFRQIAEHCAALGWPFLYRPLGISRYANTQALFDRAHQLNVQYTLDEQLQSQHDCQITQQSLRDAIDQCDAVYLTICLDVLPGGQAPGVSAPAALGVPMPIVVELVHTIANSGKLIAADIAELNPTLDRDGLTARIAARLVAQLARSVKQSNK